VAGVRSALSASAKKKTATQVRHLTEGGGHNKLVVRPSTYARDRFKDDFFFYVTIGLVPMGMFVTWQNVRYGPAELREIPDDYVPEQWEYYKDPVRRFMARSWHGNSHPREYERTAYFIWKADQARRDTLKMRRVHDAMKATPTQRDWFLVPDTLSDRKEYIRKTQEKKDKNLNVSKWT